MPIVKNINPKYCSFRINALLIIAAISIVAFSCKRPSPQAGETPLARVYNTFLYKSDLARMLPPHSNAKDSAVLAGRIIDTWIKQQVFLHEALQNLSGENQDFERQIQEYKNSLTIFAFETQLVKEQLDTVVTDRQLADYYEKHKGDFKLRENIVMANYVKLPLDAPDLNLFRRLFRSDDPETAGLLEDYCTQNAATYFIDTGTWLIFNDILRDIPLQAPNAETFLRNNKTSEFSDENYHYFLKISDFQLIGSISPLAFEHENIRNIILNRRRHELINQNRNQFYQQALNNNQVEIFSN